MQKFRWYLFFFFDILFFFLANFKKKKKKKKISRKKKWYHSHITFSFLAQITPYYRAKKLKSPLKMGFKNFLAHLQLDFGKIVVDRVGYLREKKRNSFFAKKWSKNGLLHGKTYIGYVDFLVLFCPFFWKRWYSSVFSFFFCKNVLPIWKIWCLILAKCWSIY